MLIDSIHHPELIMDREDYWDKKLNIQTCGRDDSVEDDHHFPYEPTLYAVLKLLAESGWIGKDNFLLDYGCGKGRAGIFLAAETGCRSLGIDFNLAYIAAAAQNLEGFKRKDRVSFLRESAERFAVPEEADRIYFFNPFSEKVLRSVIGRILDSWYAAPRRILLMFYYPSDEYVACLMNTDELDFLDEIDCADLFPGDARERILCFELQE